ncbi:GerMN domain-containing protein [Agromyces cerinus]|uniref:Sporulation and spore germination n=1 Tax=Agromyces cerinus subsp. cerinus TaxID=232089 RepID=A0A1N6DJ72_9MICO|nr:GerMN domain-containing protein [Agromyces cerinus]SIN70777.1 Sporulation and spore germination [Agromyces cerinus subsp. cerinus]
MRRGVLAAIAAVAVPVLLAGCVSIPSSGGVNAGSPAVVEEAPELDTIVAPPAKDATPQQIVEGFIDAAQSPRNNYQAARDYLTPAFADEWSANAGATIDVPGERKFTGLGETEIVVDATPAAQLTATGQYDISESSAPVELKYKLEQNDDGQWRISFANPGLLVDETTFAQVFRSYPLYFFSPDFEFLVPDLRWFAGRDSVQTSIVRALLVGPSDWLAAGVHTAFPEGTRLDSGSVPIEGQVASVDLSGTTDDDVASVQRMELQLQESLDGVRNVESVDLSLNGVEQDVPQLSPAPQKNPTVDPRPVVFDGTAFGYLATSGEGVEQIPDLSPQVEALVPTGAALGANGEAAAVRAADGVVSVVRAGEEPEQLDPRDGLIVPAIDGTGAVWSVPAGLPGQLVVYPGDRSLDPIQLPVPWTGSSIAALEISRDSTRLVALLGDGDTTHFVAASIQRDAAGTPTALSRVTLGLDDVDGTPLDVTWLDARTVASLTAVPGGGTRVIRQELGGVAVPRQGPEGGIAIDGGNSVQDLRVLTGAEVLEAPSGVGWQARASGIRLIASQQPD